MLTKADSPSSTSTQWSTFAGVLMTISGFFALLMAGVNRFEPRYSVPVSHDHAHGHESERRIVTDEAIGGHDAHAVNEPEDHKEHVASEHSSAADRKRSLSQVRHMRVAAENLRQASMLELAQQIVTKADRIEHELNSEAGLSPEHLRRMEHMQELIFDLQKQIEQLREEVRQQPSKNPARQEQ